MGLREISINDIENIKIGNAEDYENATGCTVIICEKGAVTGIDVRGGGPASRETQLLNPVAANEGIHGLLLSGGSAFGLDAAAGIMKYLEDKNVGFPVGETVVPIVCASCLFDLKLVNHKVRPDKEMGYKACLDSEKNIEKNGNYGAGTGATVGKFLGIDQCMKSGLGCYAVQIGDLKVGAIVAVNALGDVYDHKTNKKLAGLMNREKTGFLDTEEEFYRHYEGMNNLFTGNTTIGAIITNAKFSKTEMTKVAAMAQNGFARAIKPVHTTADGDSIYAMSVGEVKADINVVGTLSATVMAEAIKKAVLSTESIYGLKTAGDFIELRM